MHSDSLKKMSTDIYNIFEAETMRELKKITSSLVITHDDLYVLIKLGSLFVIMVKKILVKTYMLNLKKPNNALK